MHEAYGRTVGTVILKIESVDDKLQSQHVEFYMITNITFIRPDCGTGILISWNMVYTINYMSNRRKSYLV